MTDLEIAAKHRMIPIREMVKSLDIDEDSVECYGKYKAKIDYHLINDNKNAKLILVSAINPTSAGEGKTTVTIGLGDALKKIGKKVIIALREPSLGPVFGVKGGATGGGYAQVVPMEDINLHFTGDFHAITSANNLLCALLDNHIKQGNELNIDPSQIMIKRCLDINDRQLRYVVDGLGGKVNGIVREDGFEITVASEVMAILCLAKDLEDLKRRLANIIIAYTYDGKEVYAKDLKAQGAMCLLLKDALKPNLVQTLEKTPTLIHGGPFANIAHGCNSLIATKLALSLSDYTVTEAGFGADLGAEKFLDIKCRKGNLKPNCVVIVATIKALKYNGGLSKDDLNKENLEALKKGLPNLLRHLSNIKDVYHLPVCVAINRFGNESEQEIELVKQACSTFKVKAILADAYSKGSDGNLDLANEVVELCNSENDFTYAYQANDSLSEKIEHVVKKIYHGSDVTYSNKALRQIEQINDSVYKNLPICIAKTQYSFSDDPKLLGAPEDFTINITNIKINAGAEFIVVYTGDIMTMPGLPKHPASENIDIDDGTGKIVGLF